MNSWLPAPEPAVEPLVKGGHLLFSVAAICQRVAQFPLVPLGLAPRGRPRESSCHNAEKHDGGPAAAREAQMQMRWQPSSRSLHLDLGMALHIADYNLRRLDFLGKLRLIEAS